MKVQYQYQTDLGMLYIVQEDDAIAEVGILQPNQIIPYEKKETSLIQTAYQQLKEYFQGEGDSVSTEGMEDITNHSLR